MSDTGISPSDAGLEMGWDATNTTWVELGITSQESLVLIAADGTLIKRWADLPSNLDDILAEF